MTRSDAYHRWRDSLSDDDFWAYVLQGGTPPPLFDPNAEPDLDEVHVIGDDGSSEVYRFTNQATPCAECGEVGACGYDTLGRPMIHITLMEDEE